MSTVNPPDAISTNMGLKITLTIFSMLGFAVWGTSIGFIFGYKNEGIFWIAGLAGVLSIVSSAAMIYITSRLLFLVMNPKFSSEASLEDLHQCVARLVAFTVIGLITWVDSIVWLADNPGIDVIVVFHACNYGFVVSAVVAGLAGGLLRITTMTTSLPFTVGTPKYAAQQAQYPPSHQGSHAQYTNPAYEHPYPQQRM